MPRIASHPTFPSVTELLAAVGLLASYDGIDPKYAQLGSALHQAIAWHSEGVLDEASIHEEVRPGYDAYLEWCEKEKHVPAYSELELVHEPYKLVGHIDRVGAVESFGERCIIDWKYTNWPKPKDAALQMAGYALLWAHTHPEEPVTRRLVVQLDKKGQATTHDVTGLYDADAVFLAALVVYGAQPKRRAAR